MNAKTTSMFVLAGALVFPHAVEGAWAETGADPAVAFESALGFEARDGNGNGWRLTDIAV
ncbi:hypothetical protein ABZ805_18415 [Saccharopolyspora sp. NPDC047091]|uniref:hypothetical protein n=1 Tax=Saccharopolyspora sp. NPDC047091 TaxID=3155924 RepID=UPI0033F170C1